MTPVPNSSFFAKDRAILVTQVYDSVGGKQTVVYVRSKDKKKYLKGHYFMTLREYCDRFSFHKKIFKIITHLANNFEVVNTLDLDSYIINQKDKNDKTAIDIIPVYATKIDSDNTYQINELILKIWHRYNDNGYNDESILNLLPNKSA